jgi:prepilin-type N-terminal cleavage/methylation domain-containing protein
MNAANSGPASGRPQPSGFMLVELLVVIAVIGILVAMLLPTVTAARDQALTLNWPVESPAAVPGPAVLCQ